MALTRDQLRRRAEDIKTGRINQVTQNRIEYERRRNGESESTLTQDQIGARNVESIRSIGDQYNELVNGNVDYNQRPLVSPESMRKVYRNFSGDMATTFTKGYSEGNYSFELTPIMQDGTVLGERDLRQYIKRLNTTGTMDDLLNSDTDKLIVNAVAGKWDNSYWDNLNSQLSEVKGSHANAVNAYAQQTGKSLEDIQYELQNYGVPLEQQYNTLKQQLTDLDESIVRWSNSVSPDVQNRTNELLQKRDALNTKLQQIGSQIYSSNKKNAESQYSQEDLDLLDQYIRAGWNTVGPEDFSAYGDYGNPYEMYKELTSRFGDNLPSMMEYRSRDVNAEQTQNMQEKWTDMAQGGVGSSIFANAAVRLTNMVSGPAALIGAAAQMFNPNPYAPLDTNSPAFAAQNFGNTVTEATSKAILGDNPNLGRRIANLGFEIGISTIDSIIAATLGKALTPTVGLSQEEWLEKASALGGRLLGMNAAASAMQDVTERGGTKNQAVITGIAAGIFETFFEKFSIEQFNALQEVPIHTFRDVGRNIWRSMVTNGAEEFNTELSNIIFDTVFLGDLSNVKIRLNELYEYYLDQYGEGKEEDARHKAYMMLAKELGEQVGTAALSGALQGGLMGGTASLSSYVQNRPIERFNKAVQEEQQKHEAAVKEIESAMPEGVEPLSDDGKAVAAMAWRNYQELHPDTKVTAQQFVNEFTQPYLYGKDGSTLEQAKENFSGELLTDATLEAAYRAGAATNEKAAAETTISTDMESALQEEQFAEMPKSVADTIRSTYKEDSGYDAFDYATDALSAYNKGLSGQKLSDMIGKTTTGIDAKELGSYFTAGETTRKEQESAKSAAALALKREQIKAGTAGKVAAITTTEAKKYGVNTFNYSKLNRKQRASVKAIQTLSKEFGLNVVLYESPVTEKGIREADNGFYDPSTDTIYIDIEAGSNGEQAIVRTMAHELTHHLEGHAAKQYGELRDFLLDFYRDKGSLDSLIAREMRIAESHGRTITEADAVHEVVANACEMMLTDTEAIQTLAKEHKTLFRRLLARIDEYLKAIKKAIKNLAPGTAASQELISARDTFLQASKLWHQALAESAETAKQEFIEATEELAEPLVTENGQTLVGQLPSGTVVKEGKLDHSTRTWTQSEKERVKKELLATEQFSEEVIDKWISDVTSVAATVLADPKRLDYYVENAALTMLKPNQDYHYTLDASTLCAKRLLYQGTFNAIQKVLGNVALLPEDLIDLSNMMRDMGYETPCGICYVESRRRWLDKYAQEWLDTLTGDKPTIDQLTTTDGLEALRKSDYAMYKAFIDAMNAKGSANPKVVQLRTEYNGDIGKLTKAMIQAVKNIGGLRIQSFSDFEVPHMIDMMQAVMDMAARKLTAQAYTKVPAFAAVFGKTGIKINLSLIGKGRGVDANGNLLFDDVEGMPFEEAMRLRNMYSHNVGTILVGINEDHIIAAMADGRIDFIIPFHRSGWSENELVKMPVLMSYQDFQKYQNEQIILGKRYRGKEYATQRGVDNWIKTNAEKYPEYTVTRSPNGKYIIKYRDGYITESFDKHKERTKISLSNLEPVGANQYWDYDKSGRENAETYLRMCAESHRMPKFWNFLVDNGDGSFSLPTGSDFRSTAIREGYWKTLIDFKMYDNEGFKAPQQEVIPRFNMEEANRILNEYTLDRKMPNGRVVSRANNNELPVAQDVVDRYVEQFRENHKDEVQHSSREDLDAEYEEALEDGNEDWERQLVAEAAYEAGYTTGAYHGSPETNIQVFNTRSTLDKKQKLQLLFGTHFTQNRSFAELYAKKARNSKGTSRMTSRTGRVYDVYLDLGKSLNLRIARNDQAGQELFDLYSDLPERIKKKVPIREYTEYETKEGMGTGQYVNTGDIERALDEMPPKDATEFLVSHGYNSVLYDANYNTGAWDNNRFSKDPSIIMLDPERIKSADPVTYDENGNVLMPSERFDRTRPDIQHSMRIAKDLYQTQYDFSKPMPADEFVKAIRDESKAENYFPKGLSKEFLRAITRKSVFNRTKLYRGMEAAEYGFLLENKYLKSKGEYNFSNQVDQTLADEDPATALAYATSFAPRDISKKHYSGDMLPSYIVEFLNSSNLNVRKNEVQESYTTGTIDQEYITRIFEIMYDPETKQDMVQDVTDRDRAMFPKLGEALKDLAHGVPLFYRDKTTGTILYAVQGEDGWETGQYISEKDPGIIFDYDKLQNDPAFSKFAAKIFGVSGNEEDLEPLNARTNIQRSSRATDAEYLQLAEDPEANRAQLQEMVDAAARKAGYTIKGYHGTDARFNVFSKAKQGSNWDNDSRLGPGFYFAHDYSTAQKWTEGTRVIDAWLSIKKPLDLRGETPQDIANKIREQTEKKMSQYDPSYPITKEQYVANLRRLEGNMLKNPSTFLVGFKYDQSGKMTDGIREFLSGLGYDGIISDEEIVVFDPEQIKSADPVTYDDNGDVIPLSERFNTANDDIRYSRRSAQAKRDSGDKLTEYEFYSLYSAHKLNLRRQDNIQEQIESIRTDGFKGTGGFGSNLMPTRQSVSYRGVNQYNELLRMEQNGDLPEGYAENFRKELGDEYGKPVPGNVSVAKYAPRKGEYILLVPKSGAEISRTVDRVKPGYKPSFDWEIVQADYDYQPYYEMYSKAYDAANTDVQFSTRANDTNFDRWFGNSKIVNEDGTPRVVYHQTAKDFSVFDNRNPVAGRSDSETPGGYFFKDNDHDIGIGGDRQMAVYLRMERPLHFANRDVANRWYSSHINGYNELQREMQSELSPIEKKMEDIETRMFAADTTDTQYEMLDGQWNELHGQLSETEDKYRLRLHEMLNQYFLNGDSGYDGIILDYDGHRYVNGKRENVKTYIVFDNTQIKSATGNNGEYSRTDPNIYYSTRETLPEEGKTVNQLNKKIQSLEHQLEQMKHRLVWVKSDAYLAGQMEQGKAMAKEQRAAVAKAEQTGASRVAAKERTIASRDREIKALNQRIDRLHEILDETRQRRDEALGEMRQYYKDRMDDYKESQSRQYYRDRVMKRAKELLDWVTQPNVKKSHYVPDALLKPVTDLLSSINMASTRSLAGGADTKADERLAVRLRALENVMQDLQGDSVYTGGGYDLDPDLQANLNQMVNVATAVANTGATFTVNSMTAEQLHILNNVLRGLKTLIRNANRLYSINQYRNIDELSQEGVEYLQDLGDEKRRGNKASQFHNFMNFSNMLPVWFFDRLGPAGQAIFSGLAKGQTTLAQHAQEVLDFTKNVVTPKEVKDWRNELHTIKRDGKDVTVTAWQLMELAALYNREQAQGHLFGGGVRFTDIDGQKADKGGNMSLEEVLAAIGQLSERQSEVISKMQEFISNTGGAWGNEISQARYGRSAFPEKHYWPIRSDANHLATQLRDISGQNINRLLNASFTKPLTQNANNSVIIGDAMDTFAAHMSDMAQYNAFALPILDIVRFINYQERTDNEDGSFSVYSMKDALTDAFGKVYSKNNPEGSSAALKYLYGLLDDINGQQAHARTSGIGEASLSRMKRAAVAANLRVALLQPTAVARAALLINPKYLVQGLGSKNYKADIQEMLEHSGIARWKELGFFEINVSRSLQQMIAKDDTFLEKAVENSMAPAGFMDRITWGVIWRACRADVRASGQYEAGSQEFFDAVTKRFEDIIYRTQVVDSVLTKSHLMRNGGDWDKVFSSFMSEPTTTYNMIAGVTQKISDDTRAYGKAEAWKRNRGKLLRTAVTFILSEALVSVAEALADAWRDDDEFEDFPEKFRKAYPQALIDNLNPLGLLPYASQINDVIKKAIHFFNPDVYGFDAYNGPLEFANDLLDSLEIVSDWVSDKKTNYTVYGMIYKALSGISTGTGLPMSAALRELVAVWNNFVGQAYPQYIVRTYDPGDENRIKYAWQDGDITSEEALEYLQTRADKSESEAQKILSKWVTSEAKQTYQGGDTEAAVNEMMESAGMSREEAEDKVEDWRYDEIRDNFVPGQEQETIDDLVNDTGMDEDDAYWRVQEWSYEAQNDDDWHKYDAFYAAVETGKDLRNVIQTYLDNGVEAKTLASQITSQFKPQYIELYQKGKASSLLGYLLNAYELLGYNREKKMKDIERWVK